MTALKFAELEKMPDVGAIARDAIDLWERSRIYEYDPASSDALFSVDTPPPYVSADHLHMGHAMSYVQAEIMVRYKRMRGYNVFYPMGFDDNGLPTERFVEQKYNLRKSQVSRPAFRELCLKETQSAIEVYRQLWKALGLSVDWRLTYSTIDPLSRQTAQQSFVRLFKKGLIYRANDPVIWDTHFETSLAQSDLETISRKGKLYDIAFHTPEGEPLVVSTTRPEMLPACVALFHHPEDERYAKLVEKTAVVPVFGSRVPILRDEFVDQTYGSGLMMVCTFGDGEDVKKWKDYKLDSRVCINHRGRMTEAAGLLSGLTVAEAKAAMVKALQADGFILGEKTVDQNVSVAERSGTPVEFIMEPQWFVNVLDHRNAFRQRAAELEWHPEWMRVRLLDWIDGLKYNWNISRQRYFGVPFPTWFVQETGEAIVADEKSLPVDPTENEPPQWAREKYNGMTIVPDTDVMDTWMTSSLTPMINGNWVESAGRLSDMRLFPMSLRVQAFEIIRTWLFYSIVQAEYHESSIPWTTTMISGWGLNEQGKKLSKRDLQKFTDDSGYNRYEPYAVIQKYGADAIRYWAASGHLGRDLRYNERDVRDAYRISVKLWNVTRLVFMYLDGFDYPGQPRAQDLHVAEDKWIVWRLNETIKSLTERLEAYEYSSARDVLQRFFLSDFCDDYLELVKCRFWQDADWDEASIQSGRRTVFYVFRVILGLFAPYMPFITEAIYQRGLRFGEDTISLHKSAWPGVLDEVAEPPKSIFALLRILGAVRKFKSMNKVGANAQVQELVINVKGDRDLETALSNLRPSLLAASRAASLRFGPAEFQVEGEDIAIDLVRAGPDLAES